MVAIEASVDTAELATYLTSSEYSQWQPIEMPNVEEVLTFSGGSTTSAF